LKAYIDTSALTKCYISEPRSLDVLDWVEANGTPATAVLTVVEFRCVLARRRRNQQIDQTLEHRALAEFDSHVRGGAWQVHQGALDEYAAARDLIDSLPEIPLRALDALHLAAARTIGARHFATADKTQADAAEALGFTVHRFC
jgi:hypothetical protein